MSKPKNPIEELDPDLMKEAILKKDVSFLTVTQQKMFDRVIVANDLLKKYRRRSAAIKFMCVECPELSSKQVGRYVDLALKIFNHEYKVDWDFMTVMAYDSIMENIEDLRERIKADNEMLDNYSDREKDDHVDDTWRKPHKKGLKFKDTVPEEFDSPSFVPGMIPFVPAGANPALYQAIAREHANLLKFIGLRPKEIIDESIFEKQTYTISISINGKTVELDLAQYNRLDQQQRQNLSDAMIESGDIDEAEALKIFET